MLVNMSGLAIGIGTLPVPSILNHRHVERAGCLPLFDQRAAILDNPLFAGDAPPRFSAAAGRVSMHSVGSILCRNARMANALTLTFPQPDVALITFELPGKGANIL